MKKIKLNLNADQVYMLSAVLQEVRELARPIAGIEVEMLCCREFFGANLERLQWPEKVNNKFQMAPSQAVSILKTLYGYNMSGFDVYARIQRDDVCDMLHRQVQHLLAKPIAFTVQDVEV